MTQKDDGGPAFPTSIGYTSMSLRDYFAVQATEDDIDRFRGAAPVCTHEEARYRFADAMLAARRAHDA